MSNSKSKADVKYVGFFLAHKFSFVYYFFMITFDSLTLKAFIEENREFLTGARIQRIQQPTRRDFVLTIRGFDKDSRAETRKLYININPQLHHICFMSKENEEKRLIEIPQKPPMFCMLLRKYLENARICKVNQPPYERIFELYIETFNELSEKIHLCLAIELMGKHSNVVLYNDDTNVIIGCAHNVGAEKSREREMAGTLPYVYPPKQNKIDILNYNGEINFDKLNSEFYWFSKTFASQVKGATLTELQDYVCLKGLQPAISKDYKEYSLFSELLLERIEQKNVNTMLDNYYAYYIEKDKFRALKTNLTTIANQKLRRDKMSLAKMQIQIGKEENGGKYRLYGDLIMANLYQLKDFSSQIEVYDYENNQNIIIELDETKSLKDNANRFYKLYTKSKTSIEKLTELSQNLSAEIAYYEQILYSIDIATGMKDLLEIKSELLPEKEKKDKKNTSNLPIEFEVEGQKVFVGRNNRQNDYIVSKLSIDEDYWFHIKDGAGSHVLLKVSEPSDKLIYECAKLAKEYSTAKMSTKAGVIYTKRKYLKKPPKANLGYVTYKFEKEIVV